MILYNFQGFVASQIASVSVALLTSPIYQVGVYFTEVEHTGEAIRYVPRSVQIDLEEGVCNHASLHSPT